jgi:NCAIR mutase (PurE)-related protein
MQAHELQHLLERWRDGHLSLDAVQREWAALSPTVANLADVRVDLDRPRRCGFPEVVYGSGKTPEQVLEIVTVQQRAGQASLITRATEEHVELLHARFPSLIHEPTARTIRVPLATTEPPRGHVAVLTAGTTDRPIALEAAETARWMGCRVTLLVDIGVAGPQRLLQTVPEFEHADAVVVVAGMEGALPSVVAGWVSCPVIAVPTSVGYGANFQGLAPLLSMLNSCAANVSVVNIDSGFKGGYLAGLIARRSAPSTTGDAE